ncbi:MAG: MoxR family ATPase [Chloroflexota bacterium]|nr:MoxR family ATPase [Chloroflexota bacterium]
MTKATEIARRIVDNVKRVILGKDDVIELGLVTLLSRGHLLIEDVPGVGKTMLARSLAGSIGCTFHRIQFTPDLLPSDVTGVSVYNQKTGDFEFRPGPIMAQVVLTDEVNRATPKTQSALLEAMEERQVTVDGVTHLVPEPFFVVATQNPIEYEGTFPLPEAQLDRFLLRVRLGYPGPKEELAIMESQEKAHPIESLKPVATPEEILYLQQTATDVYVDPLVRDYIVALVDATRKRPEVALGASPRAVLGLFRASRALAMVRGRDYVVPDDVKALAESVMAHRIIVSAAARMRGADSPTVISELLGEVAVPGLRASARPA